MNDGDGSDDGAGSNDLSVSPAQFAALFPFHVAFDDSLRITQLGSSHARLLPSFAVGQHLPSAMPWATTRPRGVARHGPAGARPS